MTSKINPFGSQTIAAASGVSISVKSDGPYKIYTQVGTPNHPSSYQLLKEGVAGETYTSSALSAATNVRIDAYDSVVFYEISNAPNIALRVASQATPTAKTVSSTMTAADIKAGLITINQGAGGASAQQLPLATAMDTACPDMRINDYFDFVVVNTSTVDAEDATITTNTGWTLVGAMDIPAYNAAGSLNSSALFRARRTGVGAWSLTREA